LRAGGARFVAALDRCYRIALRAALADHLAGTQRQTSPSQKIML